MKKKRSFLFAAERTHAPRGCRRERATRAGSGRTSVHRLDAARYRCLSILTVLTPTRVSSTCHVRTRSSFVRPANRRRPGTAARERRRSSRPSARPDSTDPSHSGTRTVGPEPSSRFVRRLCFVRFQLNRNLVDMDMIPEDLVISVVETFESVVETSSSETS